MKNLLIKLKISMLILVGMVGLSVCLIISYLGMTSLYNVLKIESTKSKVELINSIKSNKKLLGKFSTMTNFSLNNLVKEGVEPLQKINKLNSNLVSPISFAISLIGQPRDQSFGCLA